MNRIFVLSLALLWLAASATAEVFVYPRNGQSAAKQEQDEFACYKWAKSQSGVDPAQAGSSQVDRQQRLGGMLRGAARSAAVGAAVGEIVDDEAGKGAGAGAVIGAARGRQQAMTSEQQKAASTQDRYARAFGVCMDARGYSVK